MGGHVGTILAHFSLLSASWVHFSRLAAFVVPVGRFFHALGRSSLDFGAPSWPYVGAHFAVDGIFRHAAGIAAKKPCWHSLSAFRFHNALECGAAVLAQHMESSLRGLLAASWTLLGPLGKKALKKEA